MNRPAWLWVAGGLLLYCIAFHVEPLIFGRTYFSLDTFAYFYPMESYYATSLRSGQLPLWNPYIFGGVPFLANSQTGVYYPFNLAFLLGPIPYIYAVELAAHSLLAAGGMVWFGRRFAGLGWFGAMVAGLAFGFGGAMATMAGHLNQVQVAAWLPWMLGAGHQLVVRPGLRPLVTLALLIALQALAGHSQQLYIGLCALASYSAWTYLRLTGAGLVNLVRNALWHRLAVLAGAAVLAAGLAAAQLVPTIELASLSIRAGGLSYWEATAFSLPPFKLVTALIPPLAGGAPFSEFVGYAGIVGLVLATVGLIARFGWTERFWLSWSVASLFLALGHYTPLYYPLYELVPGFDIFRAPARWLVLFSFGASVLAGLGAGHIGRLDRPWRVAGQALGLVLAAFALAAIYNLLAATELVEVPAGWWWILGLVLALGLVLVRWRPRLQSCLLITLLAAELLVGAGQLDSRQVILADAFDQMRQSTAHLLTDDSRFRVLSVGESTYDPGDLKELRRSLSPFMTQSQVEAFVEAIKYVETFQPNLPMNRRLATIDGYDGGLLPLQRYLQLKRLFQAEGKDLEDGRLRYQIAQAPDPELLGWLNVKYVVMDRTRDLWLDGVYYDLGLIQSIEPGASVDLVGAPAFDATAVGLIVSPALSGDLPPEGLLTVVSKAGEKVEINFDAGRSRSVRNVREDLGSIIELQLTLPAPVRATLLNVSNLGGAEIDLRSVSLVNEATGHDRPVATMPGYQIAYLGDLKVYENMLVSDRIYPVGRIRPAVDEQDMLATMQQNDFNPREEASVLEEEWVGSGFENGDNGPGSVEITHFEPGRIDAIYKGATPALLVFTESHYPGWRASIDGKEASILLTNIVFQGVVSPAGEHTVEFRFEPASVRIGQVLSVFSLILAISMFALGARRSLKR